MSAITALQQLIDATIQADGTLSAKLHGEKVYSLTVPELDSALPYIVLGQSVETRRRTFDSKFQDGVETIDVWSADVTKFEAADLVADLERLFDGTRLTLSGGLHFVTGELVVLALLLDPSGKYAHASCRYSVLTYV